jgi:hypothetical protein
VTRILTPHYTYPDQLGTQLCQQGYAVMSARGLCELSGTSSDELEALRPSWNSLAPDNYLKDGGRYRKRRHSCFVVEGGTVSMTGHRAHWQPLEHNALHGGIQRWFEPVEPQVAGSRAWNSLLITLARVASVLKGGRAWYVEAHQFRIDTEGGIGRPTPEGAHRDGVDFVAVVLLDRHDIKGGETRVFEVNGSTGQRFTLTEPWSVLVLDDERVIHESTPIQPLALHGHRDTLVLTFRAGGFQSE